MTGKTKGSLHIRYFYRMPESFRAFCNIVSFTAANTSRIFVVSVACVKLYPVRSNTMQTSHDAHDVLWIDTQSRPICLHELP